MRVAPPPPAPPPPARVRVRCRGPPIHGPPPIPSCLPQVPPGLPWIPSGSPSRSPRARFRSPIGPLPGRLAAPVPSGCAALQSRASDLLRRRNQMHAAPGPVCQAATCARLRGTAADSAACGSPLRCSEPPSLARRTQRRPSRGDAPRWAGSGGHAGRRRAASRHPAAAGVPNRAARARARNPTKPTRTLRGIHGWLLCVCNSQHV